MAVMQPPTPHRRRRWLIVTGIVGAVLIAYALTLTWATQRLETDLQKSIRPLPVVQPAPRVRTD